MKVLARLTVFLVGGSLAFLGLAQEAGAREYDPKRGRFAQRDPAFADENWYVYCRNNPVNNVDPTGLITIPVHGTGKDKKVWVEEASPFAVASGLNDIWRIQTANLKRVNQLPGLFGDLRKIPGVDAAGRFRWTGLNSHTARIQGGTNLASYLTAIRRHYPNEPIHLIGHSHGGNVIAMATRALPSTRIDTITYLGKPWMYVVNPATQTLADVYPGDYRNVGRVLNLYSGEDKVQAAISGRFPGEVPLGASGNYLLVSGWPLGNTSVLSQGVGTDVGWRDAHTILHGREIAPSVGEWIRANRWIVPRTLVDDSPAGLAERLRP